MRKIATDSTHPANPFNPINPLLFFRTIIICCKSAISGRIFVLRDCVTTAGMP